MAHVGDQAVSGSVLLDICWGTATPVMKFHLMVCGCKIPVFFFFDQQNKNLKKGHVSYLLMNHTTSLHTYSHTPKATLGYPYQAILKIQSYLNIDQFMNNSQLHIFFKISNSIFQLSAQLLRVIHNVNPHLRMLNRLLSLQSFFLLCYGAPPNLTSYASVKKFGFTTEGQDILTAANLMPISLGKSYQGD